MLKLVRVGIFLVRFSKTRLLSHFAAVVGIFSAVSAPVALAHDVVVEATPSDGATVTEFPHTLTLKFSGEPQDSFSTVAVSNADTQTVLYSGSPEVSGQLVTLNIPEEINPGPGTYTVGFQITSSDGHATRGKTQFTVAGAETDTETITTSAETAVQVVENPKTATSNYLLYVVGAGVILLVLAALITLRRK